MIFVPHRKHTYGPPWSVSGVALLFNGWMMFVPHRRHTFGSPRPVKRIVSLLYIFTYIMLSDAFHIFFPDKPMAQLVS
jgi:hypothetical protein